MAPTLSNGKICHVEIPTVDIPEVTARLRDLAGNVFGPCRELA